MRTSLNPIKNTRGATVIIALGLAMVMLIFSFGVATIVRNTSKNIKSFKNASQAQIAAMSVSEILKLEGVDGGYLVKASDCGTATDMLGKYLEGLGVVDLTEVVELQSMDATYVPGGDDMALGDKKALIQGAGTGAGTSPGETDQGQAVIDQNTVTFTCEAVGATDTDVKLTVAGQEGDWYAVPTPGTGTAGANCDAQSKKNAEDPCNWGMMSFNSGKTKVTVPLYFKGDETTFTCKLGEVTYQDENQDGVCDFGEVGSSEDDAEMILRVRTTCNGQTDSPSGICARYEFDVGDGTSANDQNATIVYWQIQGKCGPDRKETCSLLPATKTNYANIRDPDSNSEIFESEINAASAPGSSLKVWGTEEAVDDPRTETSVEDENIAYYLQTMSKPTLQLLLVAPDMKSTTTGKTIPNLEYQLLSKRPISTQETIYKVQVNYHGQSYKMMDRVQNEGGIFNFTIQQ